MDRLELAQKEAELLEAGIPYAAVTLVESSGTARTEGKMLVLSADTIFGTIGGGAGEQQAVARQEELPLHEDAALLIARMADGGMRDALSLLAEGNNAVRHYELDSPLSAEGKACGGSLTVFIESCRSTRPQLVMVGGGHVGLALLRAARLAGFATTLLDTRGEDQIGSAIAAADHFIPLENFGPALAEVPLPAGAYYVVATFSHATDGEALGGVLHHRDAAASAGDDQIAGIYHCADGADLDELLAQGITPAQLAAVHAPIGLSLGGETPEEIAVSILAELLMTRYGKTKADL